MASSKRAGLAARLSDTRVCICLGSGGVGKTTTSTALALALAARGQKVAVITIDPARRLAAALGLDERSADAETGHLIDPESFAAQGIEMRGELWAMILDPKRTFDEIVAQLEPGQRERDEILSNPIYQQLSTAVAGSQELSAIAKLYELHHDRAFDVIVLDTPPSRNAMDFLDAPTRLLGFLEGRALKVFIAPGGLTARLFGRPTAMVFSIFARVTGVDMLADLSRFFRSVSGVIEGFGERTRGVAALLREPSTRFLIVTSPEPEPAKEAVFLAEGLTARDMSHGELIVNRVHSDGLGGHSPEQVKELLEPQLGDRLAARVAHNLGDFDVLVERDRHTIAQLSEELHEGDPILIPHFDQDIQDLAGLARVAERLFA